MFVYTDIFVVPSWSLGIRLYGNMFFTELFPRNGLHVTICYRTDLTSFSRAGTALLSGGWDFVPIRGWYQV
jgi:hypothetical protein